ncbi:DUF6397 family protein [Streptomyces sp. NPDC059256]|uniref:DUF6397 family protein n=1 Tax=Streptomyces sp. NPDC059256 TaxID=3346794 RepID=UPI00368EC287
MERCASPVQPAVTVPSKRSSMGPPGRDRRVGDVVGFDRAAALLDLRRHELELAVQLGYVRALDESVGGRRGFAPQEIERLRNGVGLPALRERVRTVGMVEGARMLSISSARFARLARTGHVVPVRFSLNRYRMVVWLYLAEELKDFAQDHPALLSGRTPRELRNMLASGEDRRPRNWRGRRLGLLLRSTDDPWRRAAAVSSALDESVLTEMVPDPAERARLHRLRPGPIAGRSRSTAAQGLVEGLALAVHGDEIQWYRAHLAQALREARATDERELPDRHSAPGAETERGRTAGDDLTGLPVSLGEQQEDAPTSMVSTDGGRWRSPGGPFASETRLVREPGCELTDRGSRYRGRHTVRRRMRCQSLRPPALSRVCEPPVKGEEAR